MIRLGASLGYTFQGPVPLGRARLPSAPGVFAVLRSPGTGNPSYSVLDIDEAADLSEAVGPGHPRAGCWTEVAGADPLAVAYFVVQAERPARRRQVAGELRDCYEPPCADPGQ